MERSSLQWLSLRYSTDNFLSPELSNEVEDSEAKRDLEKPSEGTFAWLFRGEFLTMTLKKSSLELVSNLLPILFLYTMNRIDAMGGEPKDMATNYFKKVL